MAELLGLFPGGWVDTVDFQRLILRFGLNMVVTSAVVLWVYARRYGRSELIFTYFMFNLITFALCFLLRKVRVDMGFALGLFAVFGILRYRTEQIRARDLSYLFVVIGVAILNAVVNKKISLAELLFVNAAIVAMTAALESRPRLREVQTWPVVYDDLGLLTGGDRAAVLDDLRRRTGLAVEDYAIDSVDLLRDTAQLTLSSAPRD